jgi:hypothetical protein
MERPLGIFETAETLTDAAAPFNVVGVIELETDIDPSALRDALDRAQQRHPLLRARIDDRNGAFHFVVGETAAIPLAIVDREDDDHWRRIAEIELNRAFDVAAGPLMRCALLTGSAGSPRCELVATFSIP